MSKRRQKTTTSRSKRKPKPNPIGWGIDQAKYDAARKPKVAIPHISKATDRSID